MSRGIVEWLLAAGLALVAGAACADAPRADVRVLIDVSGSMLENDPANLRVPALELLVGLLPADTRAGIWTFAESADRQVAPGAVDDAWKQRAAAAAAAIHSRGQRTDIEAALNAAAEGWEAPDGDSRRSLILLTDGVVDTGSDTASAASRGRILGERVAALKAGGTAVHAIALSAHADHELLKRLAVASGGWYERADDADQLERLFLRMFEKATQPDTLPIAGDRFSVDGGIDEMTVLVFRDKEAPSMRLHAPDGSAVTGEPGTPGVSWRSGSGYDMVTLSAPQPGEWRIEGDTDPDNRVMVVTDLRLDVAELPSYVLPGDELLVAASMSEDGKRIDRAGFLRLVGMSTLLEGVDGEQRDLIMMDDGEAGDAELGDGVFSVTVRAGDDEGVLHVGVVADSGTFIRERRQSVGVLWPATARIDDADAPALLVSLQPELVLTDSLTVSARYTPTGGEAMTLTLQPDGEATLRAPLTDISDGGRITVALQGRTAAGDALAMTLPPVEIEPPAAPALPSAAAEAAQPSADAAATPPPPAEPETPAQTPTAEEPPPEPPRWGLAIGLAGAVNAALAALLGGLWWWRRRRTGALLQGFEAALAPAA